MSGREHAPRQEHERAIRVGPRARRRLLGVGAAAAALLGVATAAGAPQSDTIHLELVAPVVGAPPQLAAPWVEVRGWAAAGPGAPQDLVLVLDLSGSTLEPSGIDVDGDGAIGEPRRLRGGSSDPGDTVRAAEVVAARRLVDGLDLARTRVAVLVFADNAWTLCPLTPRSDEILGCLDEVEGDWLGQGGATDLSKALRWAGRVLRDGGAAPGAPRRRDVVLLSDGEPTAPGTPAEARAEALAAAGELAREGVRVQTFALGTQSSEALAVYGAIAERTGGRTVRLSTPGDVVHHLPQLDLAGVAGVEVANATSRTPSRVTHRGADGSFEAFVPLVPGENRIRVVARGRAGGEAVLERIALFMPRTPRDAAEEQALRAEREALLARLAQRSAQLELVLEMKRARAAVQQRELELEAEDAPR